VIVKEFTGIQVLAVWGRIRAGRRLVADAPALARRFHNEVRTHLPHLEELPQPNPMTLTLF